MNHPDWTTTLRRMTKAMRAHPDWNRWIAGTPLDNDLPVIAAKMTHEIIHELMDEAADEEQ